MSNNIKNRIEELKNVYKEVRGYDTAAKDTVVEVKDYIGDTIISTKDYIKEKIWES